MKKHLPTILIIFVFLVGGAVFLYPTVSNYLYQKNSTRAITERTEKISSISSERIAEEKEAVRRYNKSRAEGRPQCADKTAWVLSPPMGSEVFSKCPTPFNNVSSFVP